MPWPRFSLCVYLFPACKFFDLEVQFSVGPLARPVTADQTHDHPRHDEYAKDNDSGLHHMSVPFIRPSATLIAIAEMNMPVSMYNKSI